MVGMSVEPSPGASRWLAYPAALGACLGAALIGSLITSPHLEGWYAGLAKPWFTPPNRAFPFVWTLLYLMMGVAAGRVAAIPRETPLQRRGLVLFAAQLVLNVAWSFAFFGRESPEAGMLTIVFLFAAIGATTTVFWRLDRLAAWLMVPYLAWVGFAVALNAAIVALN
jgi:benzodiazapine receptor